MKRIGRLNSYFEKCIRDLLLHYKHPFGDVKRVEINTKTGEIWVDEEKD